MRRLVPLCLCILAASCGDPATATQDIGFEDTSGVDIAADASDATITSTSPDDTSTSTSPDDTSTSTSPDDTSPDDTSTGTSPDDTSTSTGPDDTSTSTGPDDTSTSTSPDTSTSTSPDDTSVTTVEDTTVTTIEDTTVTTIEDTTVTTVEDTTVTTVEDTTVTTVEDTTVTTVEDTTTSPDATTTAECGNGVPEAGEGCDDGNHREGDGCSAQCAVRPDRTGTWGLTAAVPMTFVYTGAGGTTTTETTLELRLVVDPAADPPVTAQFEIFDYLGTMSGTLGWNGATEVAELANDEPTDRWTALVLFGSATEAALVVDSSYVASDIGIHATAAGTLVHPSLRCGDGWLEDPETCDDHDTGDGDGCSSLCTERPVRVGEYGGSGTLYGAVGAYNGSCTLILRGAIDSDGSHLVGRCIGGQSSLLKTATGIDLSAVTVEDGPIAFDGANESIPWTYDTWHALGTPFTSARWRGVFAAPATPDAIEVRLDAAQDAMQTALTSTLTLTSPPPVICGDGFVEGDEDCDWAAPETPRWPCDGTCAYVRDWSGTYTGTLSLTARVSSLNGPLDVTDHCSVPVTVLVAEGAAPAIVSNGTCNWTLASTFSLSQAFSLSGDLTSEVEAAGTFGVLGAVGLPWAGAFDDGDPAVNALLFEIHTTFPYIAYTVALDGTIEAELPLP